MLTTTDRKMVRSTPQVPEREAHEGGVPRLTSEEVWRAIAKRSFAVLGYVTPAGDPRSAGVMYLARGRRLYIATGPESWKARHIPLSRRVSVTVTVRRGGLLSLLVPIPPATVSFHGTAIVHPAGSARARALAGEMGSLVPPERRDECAIIEIVPEGAFLTYGLGVSLKDMRDPEVARARVPVAA